MTQSDSKSEACQHLDLPIRSKRISHDNIVAEQTEQRQHVIEAIRACHGDVKAFLHDLRIKRRCINQEIHHFTERKEREFRLYEQRLCRKYCNFVETVNHVHEDANLRTISNFDPQVGVKDIEKKEVSEQDQITLPHGANEEIITNRIDEVDTTILLQHAYEKQLIADNAVSSVIPQESRPDSRPRSEICPKDAADGVDKCQSSVPETKILISAMRSPTVDVRTPRLKRVSLAIGDSVVKPETAVMARHDSFKHDKFDTSTSGDSKDHKPAAQDDVALDDIDNDDTAWPNLKVLDAEEEDERRDKVGELSVPHSPPIAIDIAKSVHLSALLAGAAKSEPIARSAPVHSSPVLVKSSSKYTIQPIGPGFRKSSVTDDSFISDELGEDDVDATPEISQNEWYGSMRGGHSFLPGPEGPAEMAMRINSIEFRQTERFRRYSLSKSKLTDQ